MIDVQQPNMLGLGVIACFFGYSMFRNMMPLWGFLLGGIGALLAVPLTLLVLISLENFEATRSLAILMRYTGETKPGENQEALTHAKDLWRKVKVTFGGKPEAEIIGDGHEQ